ncbi:Isochorismatase-like protein [Rhodotorula toruloides]|uniref:Isochorismatase-like protein n=3 Tax=Rhodotorula toruloides TaxID=5286 RepID=A0A2T0AGS5_RHOTO|nr:Isochorismatase-like protein [Rhodotorula toruloides]
MKSARNSLPRFPDRHDAAWLALPRPRSLSHPSLSHCLRTMSPVRKIVPNKTAFFVCDIQERFRLVIHAYPAVIATAEKMLKAAKLMDVPVIATEQNPKAAPPRPNPHAPKTALVALGATVPLPLLDLPSHLRPSWVPLAKTKFSMIVPQVEQQLKEWETKSVVLMGIESHVCVLQTALDLLERDIDVHVLADGISSCNGDEVGIAIKRMRDAGAQITTSESILFQIMQDAAHPGFKAMAGLVKEHKEMTKDALEKLIAGRGF